MLPTSICETLHCRGSWLFVAGPNKSLWSLMFVSDRGWVHNCLGVSRHDIHLPAFGYSNIARVIASATHQQHAAKARFTMIMGPSFLFCHCTMCLGNDFKVQCSILTQYCCVTCVPSLLQTAYAILKEMAHITSPPTNKDSGHTCNMRRLGKGVMSL